LNQKSSRLPNTINNGSPILGKENRKETAFSAVFYNLPYCRGAVLTEIFERVPSQKIITGLHPFLYITKRENNKRERKEKASFD